MATACWVALKEMGTTNPPPWSECASYFLFFGLNQQSRTFVFSLMHIEKWPFLFPLQEYNGNGLYLVTHSMDSGPLYAAISQLSLQKGHVSKNAVTQKTHNMLRDNMQRSISDKVHSVLHQLPFLFIPVEWLWLAACGWRWGGGWDGAFQGDWSWNERVNKGCQDNSWQG